MYPYCGGIVEVRLEDSEAEENNSEDDKEEPEDNNHYYIGRNNGPKRGKTLTTECALQCPPGPIGAARMSVNVGTGMN